MAVSHRTTSTPTRLPTLLVLTIAACLLSFGPAHGFVPLGTSFSRSPRPVEQGPLHVGDAHIQHQRVALFSLRSSGQEGDEENIPSPSSNRPSRLQKWRRRLKTIGKGLLFAAVVTLAPRVKPAEAKFSYEIRDERKYSIRPGATQEQASQLVEGEVPEDIPESKSVFDNASPSRKSSDVQQKKTKSSLDYGDDEDDFDFLDDEDEDVRQAPSSAGRSSSITQSDVDRAEQFQASTRASFTGVDTSKTKTRALYAKVSVGLFIPTWGAMGVREFVRRRKEEVYVQKGLEILEAQKAEYFGVDDTNTTDAEIQDALKDGEEGDDEDDEDSDDEDDDEDDEDEDDDEDDDSSPPPRKGPKRPSGDGGGSGSGGDGGDPGYGRPSDDDLKKLGDLFNKS